MICNSLPVAEECHNMMMKRWITPFYDVLKIKRKLMAGFVSLEVITDLLMEVEGYIHLDLLSINI